MRRPAAECVSHDPVWRLDRTSSPGQSISKSILRTTASEPKASPSHRDDPRTTTISVSVVHPLEAPDRPSRGERRSGTDARRAHREGSITSSPSFVFDLDTRSESTGGFGRDGRRRADEGPYLGWGFLTTGRALPKDPSRRPVSYNVVRDPDIWSARTERSDGSFGEVRASRWSNRRSFRGSWIA